MMAPLMNYSFRGSGPEHFMFVSRSTGFNWLFFVCSSIPEVLFKERNICVSPWRSHDGKTLMLIHVKDTFRVGVDLLY